MSNSFGFDINGVGVLGIVLGIGGLAYAAWQQKKSDDLAKKLDISIADLEKKTKVEIQSDVVDKAMRNAVDREVKSIVVETAKQVRYDIRNEVNEAVRAEVKENLEKIREEVSEEISDQVAAIDEYELKNTVTKKAEEKILKKFDNSLDGVLGDFRHQLGNVQKVWESVADSLRPRNTGNGAGMTFRIGD